MTSWVDSGAELGRDEDAGFVPFADAAERLEEADAVADLLVVAEGVFIRFVAGAGLRIPAIESGTAQVEAVGLRRGGTDIVPADVAADRVEGTHDRAAALAYIAFISSRTREPDSLNRFGCGSLKWNGFHGSEFGEFWAG